MIKSGILLFIIYFLFSSQPANCQSDLAKLINYSLDHSHKIKKTELQIEEAKYMRKEVVGQGLPQVQGSGSYSMMMLGNISIPESVSAMIPSQYAPMIGQLTDNIDNLYMAKVGIQVTQLIYSQSYLVELKTITKTQELYSILKTKSEEDVIAEVASSYYQTGSLMLQLQTVEKSLNNLNKLFEIAKLNYQNDLLKETQFHRLKVSITNLEVSLQSLKNSIDVQLNYLKVMAGMPSDSVLTVDTASFIHNYHNQHAVAFNIEDVPAYQVMLKQNEIYGQQIKLSKTKFYPNLTAFGQFSYSSYNLSSNINKLTNINTVGIRLSVPIFTSGSNHAKVKQALLKQLQLQEDITLNKQFLSVEYNSAASEYQTASNLLEAQKGNRNLAQDVYNQTMLQYQEGMVSMADLLNVNSDFLQADNSYNQQILKCKIAELKMLKASGNLKKLTEK